MVSSYILFKEFSICEDFVLNILKIDDSLIQITEGNLDTVVDANASVEFSSLSSGIDDTVSKLKDYIKYFYDIRLVWSFKIQKYDFVGSNPCKLGDCIF